LRWRSRLRQVPRQRDTSGRDSRTINRRCEERARRRFRGRGAIRFPAGRQEPSGVACGRGWRWSSGLGSRGASAHDRPHRLSYDHREGLLRRPRVARLDPRAPSRICRATYRRDRGERSAQPSGIAAHSRAGAGRGASRTQGPGPRPERISVRRRGHPAARRPGARLQNSRETEERLRAILAQRTGRIEDILQVEQEIARVRGEIEEMESEQQTLEHRVDFATVDLQLTEEYKASLSSPSASFSNRIQNAFIAGLRNAGRQSLASCSSWRRMGRYSSSGWRFSACRSFCWFAGTGG